MIKKAMIMAAGVGSRLDPLTRNIPKPLVPIANVPTMDILLQHLKNNGITDVIANTHYLGEQIQHRYKQVKPIDINFDFIHEETLSGTAGGVKKCEFFFQKNDSFLVLSADGLTEVNIKEAINSHKKSDCIATMVTKKVQKSEVEKFGVVVTDKNNIITEFQEKPQQNEAKSDLINTGIYVFNYEIFDFIPENTVYDFARDVFPDLLKKGYKINSFTTDKYWSDIGSISQYIESTNDILENKINLNNIKILKTKTSSLIAAPSAKIASNATITGNCVIGENCIINANAIIDNSILWNGIKIEDGVIIKNSVITSDSTITTSIENKIIEPNSTI